MEEELTSFLLNWIREIQLATKTATQSELERENHHDHSVVDTEDEGETHVSQILPVLILTFMISVVQVHA